MGNYGLTFNFFFITRIEVETEVRKNVDELMREELKNLKMVRINPLFSFLPV
jgi:hypothetical protein